MRIGIVTYWYAVDNYGGMLQSYALQRYLRDLGHDAFLIRFKSVVFISVFKKKIKNILRILHILPNYKELTKALQQQNKCLKLRNFAGFRDKNIALSPKIYKSLKEIKKFYPKADLYITGSDQVWACDLTNPNDWIFYLDFGNKDTKRISYAASFGFSYFPVIDKMKFKELLSHFDLISVREDNGISICKKNNFNALRCVDSTFLLSKYRYMSLMSPRKYQEPFVFLYLVNVSTPEEIHWSQLKYLFETKNIKYIITTGSGYSPAKEIFDGAIYDYATVEEWLSNIYYSEIVLTSSFHGVALSIILQKDFIYLPLRGKNGSGNNRITDLLNSAGLQIRYTDNIEEVKRLMNEHIDYKHINDNLLEKLISESVIFLNNALKLNL